MEKLEFEVEFMKTLLKIFFITLVLNLFCLAQNYDSATLIDEFGQQNSESLMARLDAFRIVLEQNPAAKGYIINYRAKDLSFGSPIRFQTKLQNFFVRYFKLSPGRFKIINGGTGDELKTQVWIVPSGSKPPIADSVSEKFEFDKSALFDSFGYPEPFNNGCCGIDNYEHEEKNASLDVLAQTLKENPTAKAYLIFYGQYCNDCSFTYKYSRSGQLTGEERIIYLDSSKTITGILRKEKNYLLKQHGIDASRVITINGGYRKWQAIELWIVPQGGEAPKPKPETFPKKKRNNKR